MENLLGIFVKSIFVDNMIFAYFFGMCSYLAVSKTVKTAMGLGLAVMFVMAVTVPINYLLNKYVLTAGALGRISPVLEGVDLSFMSFITFIAVMATITQVLEMIMERFIPVLHNALGIFLPLIAVNCALLGGSLFLQERNYANLSEASIFALGSGVGWWLAIIGLAAIREKLAYSNIPKPLKGTGIAFIVTGLMGMAFMLFMGVKL